MAKRRSTTSSTSSPWDNNDDDPSEMTFSRRAARYLSRFRWYYPRVAERRGEASLDAAWHHYEHVTLPRCYQKVPKHTQHDGNDDDEASFHFVRASTSERERPTTLYPVFSSPLKELTNFGVSTRMYFSTLLVLAGILGLAGLLNIPLMVYFGGYAQDGKDGVNYFGVQSIRASALCDSTTWVECESCNENAHEYPSYRLDGTRVRRNICNFDDWLVHGLCSYAATVAVLVLVFLASWKQRKAEIVFDEAIQTASDYSIKISNPPPDAVHPEEWRQFFNHYATGTSGSHGKSKKGVVMVTIALNNAKLLRALIARRQKLQQLSYCLPRGTDMTDSVLVWNLILTTTTKPWLSMFYLANDATKLWHDIVQLEDEIRTLVQQKYKAVAVFVTFETERSQRNCLHALSTGKIHVWHNQLDQHKLKVRGKVFRVYESLRSSSLWDCLENDPQQEHTIQLGGDGDDSTASLSKALLFRGCLVLNIKEAIEPSNIRWGDLQASTRQRLELYLSSTVGMVVFVCLCGYFIYCLVARYPGIYATIFITMTNVVVPVVCQIISDFESHPTEHGKQTSLYMKITIFRWFNSAIAFVEDKNESKQQSLIYKVYPVIVAELFVNPVVDLMDVDGNFRKHVLAPRARDQEEMNACFRGSRFWLAERYTNANKVLFVALYFSSILPEALFLGALALCAQLFFGKFALLRLCGPSPDLGFYLSRLNRNYVLPVVLTFHVTMSAYWWSGYPYDDVCQEDGGGYTYCNQNFYSAGIFPPLPRFQPNGMKWMSESQETITALYGWTSVVVLLIGVVFFARHTIIPAIRSIYESTYEPDGMDQGIDFSSVKDREELHGYIPQVRVPGFVFPLLACDITSVHDDLIGWKDPKNGFVPHNLVQDVERITNHSKLPHPVFSVVRQWGPNTAE
ncbi:protease [Seminavis robusta]|uniref:Protease n=1 Tax=Seminavis robusta TaxID=568900 RepID=A0A9N8DTG6_9STRA|nr:protease [Seminavis robusta]|eukprot:Sro329_g118840.1 protease (910) ;mRNA; r:61214-64370